MAKAKQMDLEKSSFFIAQEGEATLAAIDEVIGDAKTGRTVSIEKVRKLLPKWITAFSSRKER